MPFWQVMLNILFSASDAHSEFVPSNAFSNIKEGSGGVASVVLVGGLAVGRLVLSCPDAISVPEAGVQALESSMNPLIR